MTLSLKNKQLAGRRFKRQVSFDRYIVDFYCPSEKLVIEVDGPYHDLKRIVKYDNERDKQLEELGLKVIRFKNKQVFDELDKLLQKIKEHFHPLVLPF